jgi:hypothetical protein
VLFKPVPLLGPPRISTSLAVPAGHHNYSLGGELVSSFALGAVGAEDDLWLVAAEPPAEGPGASRALLSGRILDAFGRPLAVLEGNRLQEARRPAEVRETEAGWQLLSGGRVILEVETRASRAAGCAVSYVLGLLRDRRGAVRLESRGGPDSPSLVLHGPFAYGLRPDDRFGQNHGLSEEQCADAAARMRALAGAAGAAAPLAGGPA